MLNIFSGSTDFMKITNLAFLSPHLQVMKPRNYHWFCEVLVVIPQQTRARRRTQLKQIFC